MGLLGYTSKLQFGVFILLILVGLALIIFSLFYLTNVSDLQNKIESDWVMMTSCFGFFAGILALLHYNNYVGFNLYTDEEI